MAGENRTPEKIIGEVKHAEEQTTRTLERKPREAGANHEEEAVRANPGGDPAKKKTGEF